MCKRFLLLAASLAVGLSLTNPAAAQKGKPTGGTKPQIANNTPDQEFKKGNAAYDRNNWSEAAAHYTNSLRLRPDYKPALFNRGRAYMFEGKFDAAVIDLRKAGALAPNDPWVQTWLAGALLDKGDHDDAIAVSTRSLKLDPKQSFAYFIRGVAFLRKFEYVKAIDDLNASDRLNPNDPMFYDNRGLAYQKLGEVKKANADFARRDQIRANKQSALERVNQAEKEYKEANAKVEFYEKRNKFLRTLRPPQFAPIPPELLQRRAGAWNALQDAIRVHKQAP
jgi:tetratricopeptide (TPR) repeat protein